MSNKLGTMFGDVLKGLLNRPATEKYPYERVEAPEPLRGHLLWDAETCIGCGLCAKDCPSDALDVIVLDRKAKRFVVRYHVDRCTFCAQCVASCRQGSITLSSEMWELASMNREPFTVVYGDPDDIEEALADEADGSAEA